MSFTEKMSLATGSATLALAPAAANAALVTVTPAAGAVKISMSQAHNTIVSWDVDNAGADETHLDEFHLKVHKSAGGGANYGFTQTLLELNSHDGGAQLNGRGFVGHPVVNVTYNSTYLDEKLRVLATSFDIGQTLAAPYSFGRTNVDNVRVLLRKSHSFSSYGPPATNNIFRAEDVHTASDARVGDGTHIIGFAFDSGDGLHFGWALVDLDFAGEAVEIVSWTYNDVAGDPVHVGTIAGPLPEPEPEPEPPEVPVPATIVPALALLGLGAAGIRRQRRRKAEAAKAA